MLLCHGQQIQALLVHRREHGPIDRVPVLLGTRLQLGPIVHVALQLRKLRGEVTALRVRLVLGLDRGALQHLTEDGIQIVPLLQRGRPLTGHVRWVMRGVRMRQEPQNGAQQTYGAQCLLRLKGWPWVLPEAPVPGRCQGMSPALKACAHSPNDFCDKRGLKPLTTLTLEQLHL